jgi:hypothetical protein
MTRSYTLRIWVSISAGRHQFQSIEPAHKVRIDEGRFAFSTLELPKLRKQRFERNPGFETSD